MRKVFISYHHANDQAYKEALLTMNDEDDEGIFIDGSVDTGDISDVLTDEAIREKIRDEYLKNTTVTLLLVGTDTKKRKHIDWELYSSMHDGKVNKKSGILVVVLPLADNDFFTAAHPEVKEKVYPEVTNWMSINERAEYERRYPYLPDRIIDNLLNDDAKITVVQWHKIHNNRENLKHLIETTCDHRGNCKYDLSRKLRRQNS